MFNRPARGFVRAPNQPRGFGARPGGRRGGRRGRYAETDLMDPLAPMAALASAGYQAPRRAPAGRLARAAVREYARWVMRAPDTRGLGTGLAALYPVGELAHHYATGPMDPIMLGAFGPPAALAAWVSTYKAHGSPRYSGAVAAIVAAPPLWLATAAATGITNLPTLLAYTLASTGLWSAYTWSDVLKARRRAAELQARWETIAGLTGLEGSRLLRTETTKVGVRFKVDLGVDGPSVTRLERGDLGEQIARCYGIGADQVRIEGQRKNARILWITLQLRDLWTDEVAHPALTVPEGSQSMEHAAAGKGQRSILDGPFTIGTAPESGQDLELVVFDAGGARHVDIVASNGGGKSNVLSNIVQQSAECFDVLVVAIDLGKGVIPSLWGDYLHEAAGVDEEDKALAILAWIDALVDERAIDCDGGTHRPSAQAPVVILIIDEQDTATGMESAVAADIKPVLNKVHRRGRSGGVVAVTAKQRDVVQHTGSKEGKANAYTTIVGRVANAGEMTKAVPGWEAMGCPDMSTYGGGAEGVVLLVRQGGTWQAGRTRALYDRDTVKALAAAYGPAEAHLEPHIAATLPGYADRHPVPAAKSARPASPSPSPGTGPDTGTGGGSGTPAGQPQPDNGGGQDWDFDVTDESQIDKAAQGLVARLDEFINETATPPEEAIPLTHLQDARRAIDNTTVPADAARAVIAFLGDRGPKGARRDELITLLDKPTSTGARWLGRLVKDQIIVSVGKGKANRYYLPDHDPTADHTP
ncbi:FtsK/SpoIIIE domain-containing protein [Actinomadura macrotermitis]|uniref:FtsK domain-containing protein n=1 Tax=Actinomadura macrotermitis TaxID=2585200 RepID=A0A7K0C1L8_9ACTN|nr:hypothetical protein [Actinomadura macrotermitis]MQY07256.1 hypothetical protein [Actinomadura macrotermitis]